MLWSHFIISSLTKWIKVIFDMVKITVELYWKETIPHPIGACLKSHSLKATILIIYGS